MAHEAGVAVSPKVDTGEACAFSVDSEGRVGLAGKLFRQTPEDFERLSMRDLLDPESPASRAAWAKLARGGDTSLPPEGVCVPLRSQGRIVGFVEAFGGEGLGGKENLDIFASLGNQSGSALENARLYSDLAERERRLEELVGKLITAQEEERRRVAYEIHDGLAQTALAASQRLQTFLDDFGLAPALRIHVETLRRDGMSVEYRESLGGARLSPHVETALYRVAQEALNNVRKHAPGSNARLTLYFSAEGVVRMEVADDGPGFDTAAIRNDGGAGERVGISSMRERVALLGGMLEIESRPGTTVKVEVHSRDDLEEGDGG